VQAKKSFDIICPGEEFLPKAPNPEDIIYDDGEQGGSGESGFEATSSNQTADSHSTVTDVDSLTGDGELPSNDVTNQREPVGDDVTDSSQSTSISS